jgi:phosphatidylglycerophosphatase A
MTRPAHPPAATIFRDPVHLLAFGFGSGLARWAPGTFGSLAALVVYFALLGVPAWFYTSIVVIMTITGFWICGESARKLGVHDHPGIVWDEWVGMLITLAFVPDPGLLWVILGFLLFRLFDILKPFPANFFDRHRQDGVGIVMDDVVAGLYAGFVLYLTAWVFYEWVLP